MEKEKFTELGRVEAVARLFEGTGYTPFETAKFTASAKSSCTQASALFLEGIDFDLTYFPLKHLGYKSVIAATGELYSRLAHPKTLDIRFGISAKLEYNHVRDIWTGAVTAAKEHGYGTVTLDLVPSKNGLCIAVTAVGEIKAKQPAPKSMDLICVSDNLAAAYLGFEVLEREKRAFDKTKDNKEQPDLKDYANFVGAYLKPDLNPDVLKQLDDSGIVPSAGCFVTKGLSDAVKRLSRDTGLGAKLYIDKIPFEGNSFDLGKKLNLDPVTAALNGGEDYRLIFTIPITQSEKFRRDF
ncbi:MAG: hypothetical protein LUC24_06955, partial [Bacteroidales bacterium]|nr:hypothetical protein [Bacteroidales bacterium]